MQIELTSCRVDLARGDVQRPDGTVARLTTLEHKLLRYLVNHPGRDVSHDELLEQVWDSDPAVVTRAVYFTFRRLRAKLEDDPRAPHHLLTIHGVGYRFEGGEAGARRAHQPPLPPRQTNLGTPISPLLGRDEDLERLESWLGDGDRLVTLVGPAGVGKTALVRHLGRRLSQPEVWFCDLTEATEAHQVTATIARTLGLELAETDGAVQVGRALAGRDVVLLLDNLEQVVDRAATLTQRWLADAERLVVLGTSRQPLGLAIERRFAVEPLGRGAAVQLFRDRARAAGRTLEATPQLDTLLADLVDQLDRLPLAIELAAARTPLLSPAQLRDRLEQRFAVLSRGHATGPDRHQTLWAAIEASWSLLDAPEQAALAQLSVFRGGFWLDDAEVVLEDRDGGPSGLDLVQGLLERSLLWSDGGQGPEGELRLSAYVSVAAFAADRLDQSGDRRLAELRHAQRYVDLAEALVDQDRRGDPRALRLLAQERDNLEAVVDRVPTPGLTVRGALGLHHLLTALEPARARAPIEAVLGLADQVDPGLRCQLWIARAQEPDLDRAEALARQLGDPGLLARALASRATAFLLRVQLDEATPVVQQALDAAVAAGDPVLMEATLQLSLRICIERGTLERAREVAEALRRVRREHDLEGLDARNLMTLAGHLGRRREQEELLLHDLQHHRLRGHAVAEATALMGLGLVRAGCRDPAAERTLEEASTQARRLGNVCLGAKVAVARAMVAMEAKDLDRAEALEQQALALARGNAFLTAQALHGLALIALERRAPDLLDRIVYAEEVAGRTDSLHLQLGIAQLRSMALGLQGDHDGAAALHRRIVAQLGEASPAPWTLPCATLVEGMLCVLRVRAGREPPQALQPFRDFLAEVRTAPPGTPALTEVYGSVRLTAELLERWLAETPIAGDDEAQPAPG